MRYCITAILLILLSVPAQAEQRLKFGYIESRITHNSFAVLKIAYAKLGYNLERYDAPTPRLLVDLDKGLSDGEVNRIQDIALEHHNAIRIDVPINQVEGMLISCGKPIEVTTPRELAQHRIAIPNGIRYAERLTARFKKVVRSTSDDKSIDLLLNNRVDAIIYDRPWARAQVKKPGMECLIINEPPVAVKPLFHYLHKRHKALVPQITSILEAMKESGEMERIRDKANSAYIEP